MTSYDEIAVRRALWGEKVKLTHPERIVATRRLTERGYTGTEIAGMLGVSDRTVTRLRNLDFDPSIADEGTIDAPSKEERRHPPRNARLREPLSQGRNGEPQRDHPTPR